LKGARGINFLIEQFIFLSDVDGTKKMCYNLN
jgi:hypothetical protein